MTAPDRGAGARARLEESLLGSVPALTSEQVAEAAGASIEEARRLWRALGFPEGGGSEVAYTSADQHALSLLMDTVSSGAVDLDTAVRLTRAVGNTMARLADWQVATLVSRVEELAGEPQAGSRVEGALSIIEHVGRPFEQLLIYAWRRHLAAAVSRIEALGAADEDLQSADVTVGFADLVSFTALSNEIDEDRLADLVEIFESRCADVVAARNGRVIKTLGDSVLFVSEDPARALEIAMGIVQVIGRDPRLPDVRLGLATGTVIMRMGDVYGPPVNLAARLTAIARRNRVIVDNGTADVLPVDRFETRPLPARPVRGFGVMEPIAVRAL